LVATLGTASVAIEGPYAANVVRIRVHLTQRLSSQDARSGDSFGFDTSSSAEVAGLFLAANTHGHGIVALARSAKGPTPGSLVLEARTIDLPNGKTLDVALDPGQLDRTISGDVRSYPGGGAVGGVPFDIGGSRATNIVYEKGTEFIVVSPPPPSPSETP
jgi:hypothetical protein